MRNLLLLTYHFPPSAASGAFRMLGFARHLPKYDWRVTVVAPPEMPWEPTDPRLGEQVPDETSVHPVPYPFWVPRVVRRFVPYGIWLPRAWRACARLVRESRPDAVLTSSPPHMIHLLGLRLKRRYGLPWVADFRDPWISYGKVRRLSLGQRWERFWERRVMRHADQILANAPNACRAIRGEFPDSADRIVTLTNGFDPPDEVVAPRRAGASLRLLHAGELYEGRNPLPLLDAMAGLPLHLDVLGRVFLHGVDLPSEIARRGMGDAVSIRSHLPYHETLAEMQAADVLVLFDSPGRKVGVPAKLYEYFGAGRPILALAEPDGDTANILRASGVPHRVAPPGDAARIRQAVVELQALATAAPAVDSERLECFTRERLAGQLAGTLNRLVGAEAVATEPCAV